MRILIFLLCNLIFVRIYAQAPNSFNYQAVYRSSTGQPITNQNINTLVAIKSGSGATLFSESHNVKTNEFGLFTLSIGAGSLLSGSFNNIDWSNGTKFMEVRINNVIISTAQLLSVPYALFANKSLNGWEKIQAQNPLNTSLYHNFTNSTAQNIQYFPDQYGEPFSVIFIYDSVSGLGKAELAGSSVYLQSAESFTAGNVGIGISRSVNPKAKLHVANGDIYVQSLNAVSGLILQSANGNCFRLTVSNTGAIQSTLINCP